MTPTRALSFTLALALGLALALPGPAVAFWDCDETAPRSGAVDAAGAKRVSIDARAGDLVIEGRPGSSRVEADGTACADTSRDLEDVELLVERTGDTVRIEVRMPRSEGAAALDLTVRLPAGLAVELDDTSGDVEVRGVASLDVEDGSGELRIADVAGEVTIEDGSGDVEVRGAGGTVQVRDGSGDVEIVGAEEVRIDEDGSGDLEIREVRRAVRVREDGSGDIRVADVGGDFVVDRDGSGEVRYKDVQGRVEVDED